ncbi:DEKNAAC102081 [Brettanomyces naardenensis]|uniref:Pyridoxal phosphate homeostasis protein n=1 Tax=Brettanomyces naardenensis TaxID=13370 RepID=A0A448YJW3_BRENA|nr:DEKNAAC102081 [Brettanomyces naardenensis]
MLRRGILPVIFQQKRFKQFIPSMSLEYTKERASELLANVESVKARVDEIGKGKARLVCVSKLKPASDIQALYDAGYRHFGENYVQELTEKAGILPKDINWHFIGGLQTNKTKDLAKHIDNLYAVETIDTEKKARKLNSTRESVGKPIINVFIQVNTSGEEQKSGISPEDSESLAQIIIKECPKLHLLGVMTIGSIVESKSGGPNHDFDRLTEVRDRLQKDLGVELEMSMGMSSDYEEAIRQGSTEVRVGSTIFGARPPRNGH